jgi:hypothetical protein
VGLRQADVKRWFVNECPQLPTSAYRSDFLRTNGNFGGVFSPQFRENFPKHLAVDAASFAQSLWRYVAMTAVSGFRFTNFRAYREAPGKALAPVSKIEPAASN